MKLKNLLLVLSLAGAAAFAQAPIGMVVNVNGVVTATQGTTGVTVAPGTPVHSGMRFVAGSNASVTLRLASGCTITVPAGHGVTVVQTMTCPQLAAAVQPVVPVAAVAPVAPGNAVVTGAAILAGAAILGVALDDDDDAPVSAR